MDEGTRYLGEINFSPVKGSIIFHLAIALRFLCKLTHLQYIGLQILEKLIMTRWKTLPEGQRQGYPLSLFPCLRIWQLMRCYTGIRNFIVGVNVKVASDEVTMRKEKTYINKLNLALVQVCIYI
jgi:hypothetical protein